MLFFFPQMLLHFFKKHFSQVLQTVVYLLPAWLSWLSPLALFSQELVSCFKENFIKWWKNCSALPYSLLYLTILIPIFQPDCFALTSSPSISFSSYFFPPTSETSASFNPRNEASWRSSYFFIYSCLFFSFLLGCIILSIIFSLNGSSVSFWCFTCNSLVFLPFYTWALGSLKNFIGVLSGLSFYLFALLLPFPLRNILSTLEAHCVKTKYPVFLLTSSSSFFCCCFPVLCYLDLFFNHILPFPAANQSTLSFCQEAIMNLAVSYIFLKFFHTI